MTGGASSNWLLYGLASTWHSLGSLCGGEHPGAVQPWRSSRRLGDPQHHLVQRQHVVQRQHARCEAQQPEAAGSTVLPDAASRSTVTHRLSLAVDLRNAARSSRARHWQSVPHCSAGAAHLAQTCREGAVLLHLPGMLPQQLSLQPRVWPRAHLAPAPWPGVHHALVVPGQASHTACHQHCVHRRSVCPSRLSCCAHLAMRYGLSVSTFG
jgi:hypothetical protein